LADAADLAREYLTLQASIKLLEAQSAEIRDRLKEAIGFETAPEGASWEYPDDGVKVQWVKGRTTEKLDKVKLVQAGVTKDQLEKGTVRTTFPPSMRVVAVESPDSNGD